MPRKYKRKEGVRARVVSWTTESLQAAFDEIEKNQLGINEISRQFGIPSRTLRRRYAAQNKTQLTLGKYPVLGFENEKRLVKHILKLGEAGFPPDRRSIRMLAYQFAQKLGVKHNFDHKTEMAGSAWFKSFIERNPELSIRQAEGLSVARAKGLNRDEVNSFYDLLTKVVTDNDLLDKPERIFNMDESGIQLNNRPGKVVAKKGAKIVNSVTSAEKGETMTIVGCCNAAGNFLPPVIMVKGVHKKQDFKNSLPPGSDVYMNRKSTYINTELFYKWITEHFIPNKPKGKVLLILDGHSSHSSAPDMLQAASDNDIILLCLPSHTTSALQPLDRSVFGPLKTYFNQETNKFMRTHPNKKISRNEAGKLIHSAWIRAALTSNAIAGFRGSGIFPINPNALPDTTFHISDYAQGQPNPGIMLDRSDQTTCTQLQPSSWECQPDNVSGRESAMLPTPSEIEPRTQTPVPGISSLDCQSATEIIDRGENRSPSLLIDPDILENMSIVDIGDDTIAKVLDDIEKETPSKILVEASPIPKIPLTISKRAKQSADILNTEEKIKEKREIADRKKNQTETKINKKKKTETNKKTEPAKKTKKVRNLEITIKKKNDKVRKGNRTKSYYTTDESEDGETDFWEKENKDYLHVNKGRETRKRQAIYSSSSESEGSKNKGKFTKGLPVKKTKTVKEKATKDESHCIECFDAYQSTKSKSDWIQCIRCQKWLHDTCTHFKNYCLRCGKLTILSG